MTSTTHSTEAWSPAWMAEIVCSKNKKQKSVFIQALHHQVSAQPQQQAVAQEEQCFTWQAWHEHVHRLSALLAQFGVQAGDHVAVMLQNRWEVLAIFLALRRLGAVMVPMNLLWSEEDMGYVLKHAHPRLLVTQSCFLDALQAIPQFPVPVAVVDMDEESCLEAAWTGTYPLHRMGPQVKTETAMPSVAVDATQLAVLLYTSGTTGQPKGVMLSEANLWANVQGIVATGMFNVSDRVLVALPLFHCYGLTLSLAAMSLGLPIVLEPTFQPKRLLKSLVHHRVTVLPLVPTLFQVLGSALAKGQVALPDLRLCVSGGASLPPAVLSQFSEHFGITIIEGYGMTEASPVVAVNRQAVGPVAGSVGQPLHNVSVRIDGSVTVGDAGEVQIQGDNVMLGYYQNPQATADTMTEDGWLKTGDLGHLDANGRLYLTGRIKELIIKAGENISPVAIEHALLECDGVDEVCVVGVPDEKLGERIVAVVIPTSDPPIDEAVLKCEARSRLSAFQVPDHIIMWSELPKNGVGKVVRRKVQQQIIESMKG